MFLYLAEKARERNRDYDSLHAIGIERIINLVCFSTYVGPLFYLEITPPTPIHTISHYTSFYLLMTVESNPIQSS